MEILKSRYLPLSLQTFTFLLLAYVLYAGLFGIQSAKENFAIIGPFFLFFHLTVVVAVTLLGRAWCGICPLGAISALPSKLLGKLVPSNDSTRAFNKFNLGREFPYKSTAISLLLFILAVWVLRPVYKVSEIPSLAAWFFIFWILLAVIVGLLFKKRAFCQYVCPIAAPLSVWAMFAPVELRSTKEICRQCRTHECVKGSDRVEGCPMGEFPGYMDSNRNCTFCLKCIKSCPNNSMKIRLRMPGSELLKVSKPRVIEALTAIALATVFLWHMAFMRPRTPAFVVSLSENLLKISSLTPEQANHLASFFTPLVLLLLLYSLAALISGKILSLDFKKAFAAFGYAYVPLSLFRTWGYTTQNTLAKGGDAINLILGKVGVYAYHEPNIIFGKAAFEQYLFKPLMSVPLALAAPLAIYAAYRISNSIAKNRGEAVIAALPHAAFVLIIVVLYEFLYLKGWGIIK